nr:hypothetical protein [Saccharothrix violaceirubra]
MNLAANDDLDIPATAASDATVHGRSGWRWMAFSARPRCGSRSAAGQPSRASGAVSSHVLIAWTTRMSARRVITVSPPGRRAAASRVMNRNVLCSHPVVSSSHVSTCSTVGSNATNRWAATWSNRTTP